MKEMSRKEYIDECKKQCRECGRLKYSTSLISNRPVIRCTISDTNAFSSTDSWCGVEEFFTNEKNWQSTCPYADARLLCLFNSEPFKYPTHLRKIKI